jgi:hypothetical protein
MKNTIEQELEIIKSLCDNAEYHCLLEEVIYFSLIAMQEDPSLTPSEAMAIGYDEFIK